MSRPVDWSALDLGADPVAGEPAQVVASGRHYQQVADAIEAAAARLREIVAATDMHGRTVDAFRDKASSVADDVTRAHAATGVSVMRSPPTPNRWRPHSPTRLLPFFGPATPRCGSHGLAAPHPSPSLPSMVPPRTSTPQRSPEPPEMPRPTSALRWAICRRPRTCVVTRWRIAMRRRAGRLP